MTPFPLGSTQLQRLRVTRRRDHRDLENTGKVPKVPMRTTKEGAKKRRVAEERALKEANERYQLLLPESGAEQRRRVGDGTRALIQ